MRFLFSYDEEEEYVNQYECQPLESLEKIEIGKLMHQFLAVKFGLFSVCKFLFFTLARRIYDSWPLQYC